MTLNVVESSCPVCGEVFKQPIRIQGGGQIKKFCSRNCLNKKWGLNNPERRKEIVHKYESILENKIKKQKQARKRQLKKEHGWTPEDFERELIRQNFSCYGCLKPFREETPRIDHDHQTNKTRGLLCDKCNRGLGYFDDNPETLRRLMAYLDHDRCVTNIYLIGSLKNPRIPEVGNRLRKEGYDVMDEWFTPGPEADDNWQKYEKQRGRTYTEALRGRAAYNIYCFDRSHIDLADVVVLVAPAGKSAMIELGYAKGRGKQTYLFLDGVDPERFDIMPNFADHVVFTENDLIEKLKLTIVPPFIKERPVSRGTQ